MRVCKSKVTGGGPVTLVVRWDSRSQIVLEDSERRNCLSEAYSHDLPQGKDEAVAAQVLC